MAEDKKKEWTRPQLVVLGRGKPEENVLDFELRSR